MSPAEILSDLRARGVELQLSADGRQIRARAATDVDLERIRRERLWLLMLLVHHAGGDLYDPRLAFVASAENGLTRGAVRIRMEVAFGIAHDLAEALFDLAIAAGHLRSDRGGLYRACGKTAFELSAARMVLA